MAPATDAALLRTAVVCASNMNRSMEAHRVFRLAGMDVRLRRTCSVTKKQHWAPLLTRSALNRSPPSAWGST
jgi:hypothetical protein